MKSFAFSGDAMNTAFLSPSFFFQGRIKRSLRDNFPWETLPLSPKE
jgi:hypothetical protein